MQKSADKWEGERVLRRGGGSGVEGVGWVGRKVKPLCVYRLLNELDRLVALYSALATGQGS